jgi:hypothetical protein
MAQLELDTQLLADLQQAARERDISLEALLRSWLAYHAPSFTGSMSQAELPREVLAQEAQEKGILGLAGTLETDLSDLSQTIRETLALGEIKQDVYPR